MTKNTFRKTVTDVLVTIEHQRQNLSRSSLDWREITDNEYCLLDTNNTNRENNRNITLLVQIVPEWLAEIDTATCYTTKELKQMAAEFYDEVGFGEKVPKNIWQAPLAVHLVEHDWDSGQSMTNAIDLSTPQELLTAIDRVTATYQSTASQLTESKSYRV